MRAKNGDLQALMIMAEPLELKKTLNLPKTDFPMKASLPQNEPKQLEAWHGGNIYERILETRRGKPLFVLHDGPPYPTGEIHLGTGLNKILKDLIVKTKSMAGHYAPYVPGWDCHGLPIETQVEKELGGKGKVPPAEFRKLCRQFAARYVEQHKRDFKRLGIFGRWNDPYLTMSPEYEATIAGAFLDFMEKGYVYRGRKPVYWCIYDSTALAEAEVEYEEVPFGNAWWVSWWLCTARPICLRLFWQADRLAASRTLCTAGRSRPIRIAMIAITTNNSTKVKPLRWCLMARLLQTKGFRGLAPEGHPIQVLRKPPRNPPLKRSGPRPAERDVPGS